MKRVLKIAISFFFFALLAPVRLARSVLGASQSRLTILYYHSVPAALGPRFSRQMALLHRFARVVAADWQGGGPHHSFNVAITFDDAFDSVLDQALPILAERRFPCTIFAPSSCLGHAPSWEVESDRDGAESVAEASRLANLPADRVTIGSHTMSHPHLTRLSSDDVRREVAQSAIDLQRLVNRSVTLLAFPYGDYDGRVVQLCSESGYRHVFTINPALVNPANGFIRGRVAVDPSDGTLEFFLKAAGAYAWMSSFSAAKRKIVG